MSKMITPVRPYNPDADDACGGMSPGDQVLGTRVATEESKRLAKRVVPMHVEVAAKARIVLKRIRDKIVKGLGR